MGLIKYYKERNKFERKFIFRNITAVALLLVLSLFTGILPIGRFAKIMGVIAFILSYALYRNNVWNKLTIKELDYKINHPELYEDE